jgi:LacI family transcriptional regulator
VSGFVIVPAGAQNRAIDEVVRRRFPVVLLDRTIKSLEVSSVTSDNFDGAYQATKYLLRIGHTSILFIAGGPGKSTAQERLSGFQSAMMESGVQLSDRHIVSGGYDFETSHQVVMNAIEDGVRFSAVFASADVMAFGAKRAIEDAGLRIPDDVSLIGYDDIPLCSSIGLTTVAQPAFEMGRNAITTLIHLVERRLAKPTNLVLQPRLVIRDTCSRFDEETYRRRVTR